MAIRNIRELGDDILRKKSKKVEVIDDRIITLLDDMKDTLKKADGVGLAAPQVGILKRIAIVDIGQGLIELINPEITEQSGSQNGVEGCLSVPGKYGKVERPMKVTVKAQDRNGEEFVIEAEEFLARAMCHEIDHLDGIIYVDKVSEYVEVEK